MRKIFVAWALIAALTGIIGCASAVLQSKPENVSQSTFPPDSIGYYLPKGLVHIEVKKSDKGDYEVTADKKIVPDPQYFYTVQYHPKSWANESVKVKVAPTGLLESVEVMTEDKTVEIAEKITLLIKEIGKAAMPLRPPAARIARMKVLKFIDVDVDPDSPKDLERLNDALKPLDITIGLRPQMGLAEKAHQSLSDQPGIYYRTLVPYILTIRYSPEHEPQTATTDTATVDKARTKVSSSDTKKLKLVTKKTEADQTTTPTAPEDLGFIKTSTIYLPNGRADLMSGRQAGSLGEKRDDPIFSGRHADRCHHQQTQ